LSATDTPKQFIQFGSEQSLYIKTIKRNQAVCKKTVVITDQKYADTADRQIIREEITAEVILEPHGKGTAASIMIACLMYPGETVLATPSDHEITDIESYGKAVREAEKLADAGHIVVFGIEPEKPESRFGYIETSGTDVRRFHEKPSAEEAAKYIENGYLVNSGILCFNTDVMLNEFIKFMPDQVSIARTAHENIRSGRSTHRLCGRFMGDMENHTIDRVVLEKTDVLKCVKGIKGWRDIGTYQSFYENRIKREGENISLNVGDSFGCADFVDSKGSMIIHRESDVVLCGLDDVVVVEIGEKILVAKKGADIEAALKKLEE